jgi:NADH dehydrogenase FAD-containing subunit
VLLAFEAAERETDEARRAEWLTFVIVGAGPTGVEMAGTWPRSPATRCAASSATSIPRERA